MIRKLLFIILLQLYTSVGTTQYLYIIHNQVGDTITKNEAYINHIFEDLKVDDYNYAVIHKLENDYRVDFCLNNTITPVFINQVQIDLYHQNISKVTTYLNKKTDSSDTITENIFKKAKKESLPSQKYSMDRIILFSKHELKNIGLSGAVITEEGRERLERNEKETKRKRNYLIQINNEFIEYGSKGALFKCNKPILRKNKISYNAKKEADKQLK